MSLSRSEKGIISGVSIAVAILLALLILCVCRAFKKKPKVEEEPEKEEIEVEIQEETSEESFEDVELAESKSSEYDRSISMCRSGTMNSLDVHTCASGSCDICQRNKEPNFLGVKKIEPGTEGRIRSLPDRWWENPLKFSTQAPVMQTIMSMSPRSEGSTWADEPIPEEDEEDTIGGGEDETVQTRDDSTFQLEGGIVRD